MKLLVLGAAVDHGPGRPALALSADGRQWLLLNAAAAMLRPGMPAQVAGAADGLDGQQAVVLTDAGADLASGLLSLRNGKPIDLYATPAVFERLTMALPVLPVLQHYCGVHWHLVAVAGEARHATFRIDEWPSIEITAVAVADDPVERRDEGAAVGDTIALAVTDLSSGRRLFYAPSLTSVGATEIALMEQADCVLVATPAPDPFDDEDDGDWLARLRTLPASRKVLLGRRPAAAVTPLPPDSGIELAYDGMEIDL